VPPSPLIELHGASAGYAGKPVLSGLDLSLRPAEHVAVLGRSGAGKSTLLNLLFQRLDDRAAQALGAQAFLDRVEDLTREVFGPVLTAQVFDTEEEAIDLANGTEFGLVAGVWTSDGGRQMRMARALRSGQVFLNNYGAGGGVELPFGGVETRVGSPEADVSGDVRALDAGVVGAARGREDGRRVDEQSERQNQRE
jgi:energy-coupling factor transporter ATP-binding protein EcfA2